MTARRAAIAFPSLGVTSCVGAMSADGVTGLGPGEKSGGGGTTRRDGTVGGGGEGGGGGGTTPRGGTTARAVGAAGAAGRGAVAGRGLTSLTYAGFRKSRDQTMSSSAAPNAPAASGTRSRTRQCICPRPPPVIPSAISTRAATSSVATSAQTPRASDLPNCTHDIQ